MNKNILKHIIRYLLMICIVIVCCTIFRFSSEQSTESSRTSVGVTKFIVSIIWQDNPEVNTDTLINTIHPIIRKVAHFSIYLLLGTLVMCCAQTFKGCKEYKFDASVMLCFFYACTDEFHQLFVPGRSGEFTDVCLDTVGATFGILLVMIIVWIVEKIKNRNSNKPKQLAEKNEETGLKRKVMFIASTGGHLNELMQIKPLFKKFDYHIVTEKTKVDDSFKEEYKDKISFLIYGTKKYPFIYIFKFIANCFISLYYFFRYQPEVVVTTGTHTAVPMCYIAKLFGSKVIFIETFANRTSGTVAGRLVYPIADTFVVQWEEMHKIDEGKISKKEEIIVQAGSTKYESKNMKIIDYMSVRKFEECIDRADLIICHAGVGTILTALKKGKKIIAAARLKQYGEHVNDHQLQILDNFTAEGYILALEDFDKIDLLIKQAKRFTPAKFKSNKRYFLRQLEKEINILG